MGGPQQVAIGLGSNLGDREQLIRQAVALLCASSITSPRLSSFLQTPAVGCEPDAPDFLNAVLVGFSEASPADLLKACHDIEHELGRPLGRKRSHDLYASRTIDIDILVMGSTIDPMGPPILPHPGLREREFVLRPFAEIAPDWLLPPDGAMVQACLDAIVGGDLP